MGGIAKRVVKISLPLSVALTKTRKLGIYPFAKKLFKTTVFRDLMMPCLGSKTATVLIIKGGEFVCVHISVSMRLEPLERA
jgi:hypothetical protein